jgi:hypothetical protein
MNRRSKLSLFVGLLLSTGALTIGSFFAQPQSKTSTVTRLTMLDGKRNSRIGDVGAQMMSAAQRT